MRIKSFAKALYLESVKRIPYILALLIVLLLVQGVYNIRAIRETSSTTKHLVRDQQKVLEQQRQSLDNQAKIIGNLTQAVKDLKKDNSQQTDYIQCLLALNGQDVNSTCVRQPSSVSATPPISGTPTNQKTQNNIASQQPKTKAKSSDQNTSTGRTNQNSFQNFINQPNNILGGIL